MAYAYENEKQALFTERGQRVFLALRDTVRTALNDSGAVMASSAWAACRESAPDSWFQLACFDRLVELGEVREVTGPSAMGQHRVFVRADR